MLNFIPKVFLESLIKRKNPDPGGQLVTDPPDPDLQHWFSPQNSVCHRLTPSHIVVTHSVHSRPFIWCTIASTALAAMLVAKKI
jgi:hypothetical protein